MHWYTTLVHYLWGYKMSFQMSLTVVSLESVLICHEIMKTPSFTQTIIIILKKIYIVHSFFCKIPLSLEVIVDYEVRPFFFGEAFMTVLLHINVSACYSLSEYYDETSWL